MFGKSGEGYHRGESRLEISTRTNPYFSGERINKRSNVCSRLGHHKKICPECVIIRDTPEEGYIEGGGVL